MTSGEELTLIYAPITLDHLTNLSDFLLSRDNSHALRIANSLKSAIQYLSHFPHGARTGRDPETREFPVHGTTLLIVYEFDALRRTLTILGIFNTQVPR